MTALNVTATLLFFPLYLAIRWPYFKLPVGPDTGYYVSNHTITHRKFSFCKGWNARYAMCSKFLPEAFLSSIYVKFGHRSYPFAWRFGFSIYNYFTAISVGLLSHVVTNGAPVSYLAGLISYGLISSEPDYGIFYESAEQFEILFQILGTSMIFWGLQTNLPIFVLIGVGLWFFDVFLIKITGIVGAVPIMTGLLIINPALFKYISIEFLLFLASYLTLFIKCNRNPWAVIKTEMGHQSYYSRFAAGEVTVAEGLMIQLINKLKLIKRIVSDNPFIPLFAFMGFIWSLDNIEGMTQAFLFLFLLGILLKLCVSFLPMWWYQIPLLPVAALFSSFGCVKLAGMGIKGEIVIVLFLAAWLYWNVYRVRRMNYEDLNRYTWKIHPEMGILHLEMQNVSDEIEGLIKNNSLFVYGLPSPSAMVGRSYDVNFLTAAYYLDDMNPHWNTELHKKMLEDPPAYIFSMLHGFDAQAVQENLGLKYERIKSWPGKIWSYHLYKHTNRVRLDHPNYSFQSLII